jgi:dTDP-4-amino-4,6-dideoxygalactose transaminase
MWGDEARSDQNFTPRGDPRARPVVHIRRTLAAIRSCALLPLFVDVDPVHWHISEVALADAVERHRGELATVLACSAFGTAPEPAVRSAWAEVCHNAGLPLLVDSAAGFGSTDSAGQPLGLQGDAEVFSFHATKPLAAGEGGAVVTGISSSRGASELSPTSDWVLIVWLAPPAGSTRR